MNCHRSVERQAIRMHQMMDRLNIDPGTFVRLRQGEVYTEARSRCLSCSSSDKCLRWLDGAPRPDVTPDFCPILEFFERLGVRVRGLEAEQSEGFDIAPQ
jgi:hypothetical protein